MRKLPFLFLSLILILSLFQCLTIQKAEASNPVGWELLDDNKILHIWNFRDSYYFNTSSGIQTSNHYQEYWSHNIMGVGYKNAQDEWIIIYWADSLSGFNRDIESDNSTYVNATLWKDLSYGAYDFRLAIRYHLKHNDPVLTVQPYVKNLGVAIPFDLGFGWRMKNIQISNDTVNDKFSISWFVNENVSDGDSYFLNQTLDESYHGNITGFHLCDNVTRQALDLSWKPQIQERIWVFVENMTDQYNAPVTTFLRVGSLAVDQEKSTVFYWKDADLIDSYSETNRDFTPPMKDLHPSDSSFKSAVGQTFNCTGGNYEITSCKFFMKKWGSPTGDAHAVLYAHTGTFGSSGEPTGSALATSEAFDISTLTTTLTLIEFTFNASQQYEMTENTAYCIAFQNPTLGTIDSVNYTGIGVDTSSPTHDGNYFFYQNGAWYSSATIDTCFYVYGNLVGVGIDNTYTLFENFLIWDYVTATLEVGRDLSYTLFETVRFFSSVTRGIERVFITGDVITFYDSVAATFEGIGYEFAYVLFETVRLWVAPIVTLEVAEVVAALTINDVASLAAISFIFGLVALLLILAKMGKDAQN